MSIYLIDFENVTSEGLSGIAKLQQEDKVVLFYSANAHKISLSAHRAICSTKASLEYFEVAVGGKNALDHQLSTYLGYLIGNSQDTQYFIVSKDKGYEYLSEFWKEMYLGESKNIDLKRVTSIKIAAPEVLDVEDVIQNQLLTENNEIKQTCLATQNVEVKESQTISERVVESRVTETIQKVMRESQESEVTQQVSLDNSISKPIQSAIKDVQGSQTTQKGDREIEIRSKEIKVQKTPDTSNQINEAALNSADLDTKVSTKITNQSMDTKVVDTEKIVKEHPTSKQSKVVDIKRGNQKPKSSQNKLKNTNKPTQRINPNEMTLVEQNAVVERQIREILGEDLNEEQLRRVVQSFKQSKNKQELHIKMIGAIGREKAPTMYNKIKGIMTRMEKATLAEKEIRQIISQDLQEEQVRKVVQSFKQSTTKQELHLKIVGVLGREQGPTIYNKIKSFMSKIS